MKARNRSWLSLVLLGAAGCGLDGPSGSPAGGDPSLGSAGAWARGTPRLAELGREARELASAAANVAENSVVDTAAGLYRAVSESDLGASADFALPVGDQQELLIVVESASLEEGYFALKGHVEGMPSGLVMLKGTAERISGWIAFRAEGFAYRYRTEAGLVVVEEVPFSRICPSCDLPIPRRTDGIDGAPTPRSAPVSQAVWRSQEPHIGSYTGADLLTLESRPSASKVLYLAIETVLDGSGTPVDFSKEEMWMAWQSVAAAFSPFEVNVTTNRAVYERTAAGSRGKANFTSSNDRAYCYEGVFGTDWSCEIYTGPGAEDSLGYGVGRTTAHELGHMMGMLDVGTAQTAYFEGFDEYKWYPKMGNYYGGFDETNSLFQWSRGEYAGAIDTEDMLATISSQLPYRDDDVADTRALDITGTNTVLSDSNRGIIERNTDTDGFTFQIGPAGGRATLTIDRIEYTGGGMLDVLATLRDGSGAEVATGNATAARSATIDATLGEGTYTLVIQGGAEGTPSHGFSSYGSLGYYGIDGTITGAVTAGTGGTGGTGGGDTGGTGGQGTGGASGGTGGFATGGLASAGTAGSQAGTGGFGIGGTGGTGGLATGGQGTGGASSGGVQATGGVSSGGAGGSGGSASGGVPTTGGSGIGTGGGATGGASSGGVQTTGGASSGGVQTTTGGTGGIGPSGGAGLVGTGGTSPCSTPLVFCNNACVNLATDPLHCGDCGIACPVGQTCSAGLCSATATGGGPGLPAEASPRSDEPGCACTAGRRGTSPGWLTLALGLLLMARRRRPTHHG